MAKKHKEKTASPTALPNDATAASLLELQVQGDNGAARRLATQTLSQADCPPHARDAAADALRRTGLDRPTLAAALAASAVILTLAVLLIVA